MADQTAPGPPARRVRLASPATALVLGCLTLALVATEWPFADLAHLSVNSTTGGPQWWTFTPFGWWASWWPGGSRATRSGGACSA